MKASLTLVTFLLAFFCAGNLFGQTQNKIVYGVLLDNTGSMRPQLNQVINAGKSIFQETVEKGTVSVFNFETFGKGNDAVAKVISGTGWTREKDVLDSFADGLYTVPGKTNLYDAVLSMSETVNSKAEKDAFSEKVLVLVTDGEDRSSDMNQKKLIEYLKVNKFKVFAVGLIADLDSEMSFTQSSPRKKAEDFLKKITKETGGRAVFPKRKQKIEDIVKDLFAENIKTQI